MLPTRINNILVTGFASLLFIPLLFSCRKLVEVDQPTQYVTSAATFENADAATTAVYGLYDQMKILVVAGRTRGSDLSKLSAFYADEYTVTTPDVSARELYQNDQRQSRMQWRKKCSGVLILTKQPLWVNQRLILCKTILRATRWH
jgi:hypothetical protein